MVPMLALPLFLASPWAAPLPSYVVAAEDASDEIPGVEDVDTRPEVFLVSRRRKEDCVRPGHVCMFANGAGTVAGFDVDPMVGIVTTLARGTEVATIAKAGPVPEADAWHVEMIARLKYRSAPGTITVAVLDYADPEGMARKEATAVWQVEGPGVKDLGMRFVLSAEDGFRSHHTYLVRVVQGDGAHEKILAEGNFLLE